MRRSRFLLIALVAMLVAFLAGAGVAFANPLARPQAVPFPPAAPTVVSYQGQVQVGGSPFSGAGYFQFAVVNAAGTTTYWSHDGTSTGGAAPTTAVELTVTGGLFTVLLGDTTTPGMTQPLNAAAFSGPDRYLRVWFSADGKVFTRLTPDRRIASVPYALQAEHAAFATTATNAGSAAQLAGLPADAFQQKYGHVIVVATSGGDYTTIGAALASIGDNGPDSRYLIWVAPGTYSEKVTMKPYVDIEGAGELATTITSAGSTSYDTAATVTGADNAELRFLSVENTGGATYSYAVAIYNGAASPRLTHVTAYAHGAAYDNSGVYNLNSSPRMVSVTATASGAAMYNTGVYNVISSSPEMRDVTATASGGSISCGVYNLNSSSPEMASVTATASGATYSYGVYNDSAGPMTMIQTSATASGGTTSNAIRDMNGSVLTMTQVTAIATGTGSYSVGVYNNGSTVTVLNSSIRGLGTASSRLGIMTAGTGTVRVDGSQISGATCSILGGGTEHTFYLGASQLSGPVLAGGSTFHCVGVYDGTYAGYTCP